jgi:endonuclease/exonuclease/phosphatase family metal-dependent hydrolase
MARVRLATFNLMNGRSLQDGLVEPDRLRDAVRRIDADVLGLQEVDRAQDRSGRHDLASVAAEAMDAKEHCFIPAVVGTPGEGFRPAVDGDEATAEPHYGIALLSRWPVIRWQITRLPGAPVRLPLLVPGPGGRLRPMLVHDEPRVMIAAVVKAPTGPITVATTHLSFVPGWNLRQLRRAITALWELPAPRLLLGDLNLPAAVAGIASGWLRLGKRPTYPAPAPQVQFDHVLLDPRGAGELPRVCAVSTPIVPVSDHRPLVVELGDHR